MSTQAAEAEQAPPAAQSRPCNLCGGADHEVVFEAGVAQEGRIVRCRACGFLFVNPLGRTELSDYRERGEGDEAGWELSPSSLERQQTQVLDYRAALDWIKERTPRGGRVLEVGPNTGTLLNELQQAGLDCLGLEPNGWAARYGRERFGLDLRTATLEEAALPDAAFDAILHLHVIEHVPDPAAMLRELARVMKPGGILVLETPRYDTWSFKLLGRRERNVSDDWHLSFFETATLRKMVEAAGFQVEKQAIPGRTLTFSRLLVNLGKVLRLRFVHDWGVGLAKSKWDSRIRFKINIRDILRLHLLKPAEPGKGVPGPPRSDS